MGPPLVGVGQGVGPLQKKAPFFVRAPPPGPLRRGVVPLTGYPPSSQRFLSPPWARTWDHELRYPFEVVPTTNWATGLLAQLVVGTTSNGYLSLWSQVRAHGGERNPCELGGQPVSGTTPRRSGPGGGALTTAILMTDSHDLPIVIAFVLFLFG